MLPSLPYHLRLIREDRPDKFLVIHVTALDIDGLEQLVHLVVAHLLAQVREDIAELADADEAREFLVEDLEAARVGGRVAWVAEAVGPVEDGSEGWEVDCAHLLLDFFVLTRR